MSCNKLERLRFDYLPWNNITLFGFIIPRSYTKEEESVTSSCTDSAQWQCEVTHKSSQMKELLIRDRRSLWEERTSACNVSGVIAARGGVAAPSASAERGGGRVWTDITSHPVSEIVWSLTAHFEANYTMLSDGDPFRFEWERRDLLQCFYLVVTKMMQSSTFLNPFSCTVWAQEQF